MAQGEVSDKITPDMNAFMTAVLAIAIALEAMLCVNMLAGATSLMSYGIGILAAAVFSVIAVFIFRPLIKDTRLNQSLLIIAVSESLLAFLMASAVYKLTIYDNSPQLGQQAFWVVAFIAMIYKCAWFWWQRKFTMIGQELMVFYQKPIVRYIALVLSLIMVFLLVAVPNPIRIVALSFIGEQWHHWDYFIMSPGLAVIAGGRPYMDVLSQYGVGIPYLLSHLMQMMGGFTYEHGVQIVISIGVLYFMAMLIFIRFWLSSLAIALAAVLTAIRLDLCHFGVSPLVWLYPSTSPIRLCFDIGFFVCLLMFCRNKKMLWLVMAGLWAGFSIFFMSSTGISLYGAYVLIVTALLILNPKNIIQTIVLLVLPLAVALLSIASSVGNAVIDGNFWARWGEYMHYFANGHAGGVLPFYDSLKYRNYLSWLVGASIPILYLFSSFYVVMLWWRNKQGLINIVIAAMGVYGLLQYSYYVVRSAQTSYYMVGLPLIWIGCFWLKHWLEKQPSSVANMIKISIVIFSAYALLTNHNYLSYPSYVSLSKNTLVDKRLITRFPDRTGYFNHQVKPIKAEDKIAVNNLNNTDDNILTEDDFNNEAQLIAYMKNESDFTQDAQLIASLTGSHEKVAILSSFETAILMQAKRAPFFYHTPMITSRPMRVRTWPADAAHSPRFLTDSLAALEQSKPAHIFTEKIFLEDGLPASYTQSQTNIMGLITYIKKHYTPVQQGQYLVAWQRKD